MHQTSTVLTGPAKSTQLVSLDVSEAHLLAALEAGYVAAASCTDHEPRSYPGTTVWAKGIGHLRDLLVPLGWTADRSANFETVVHPSNSQAVAIAAGTSQVGIEGIAPRTRTPRGPATNRAVKANQQMTLGIGTDAFTGTGVRTTADRDRVTWLLLHYLDPDEEEVRVELSLPLEMSGKQISRWKTRIPLKPFSFSQTIDFEHDEVEEIDIDVSRRAD